MRTLDFDTLKHSSTLDVAKNTKNDYDYFVFTFRYAGGGGAPQ